MKRILALVLMFAALLMSAPVAADPVEGPRHGAGVIDPGETDAYTIMLRGGETTIFAIVGDSRGGDIDCALYDDGGHIVAFDADGADSCRVAVTPRWTGMFRLVFVNSGDAASIYATRIY